ncbi:MAG: hypothetical protein ACLFWL_12080 [Candidatus Brocadiia bacterium]|nr:hypothetical protein [Planctomycetota bacterium]
MPAAASLEELEEVQNELESLKMKHGEAYDDFVDLFKRNRSVGYKNICKMLIGDKTARELKGLD